MRSDQKYAHLVHNHTRGWDPSLTFMSHTHMCSCEQIIHTFIVQKYLPILNNCVVKAIDRGWDDVFPIRMHKSAYIWIKKIDNIIDSKIFDYSRYNYKLIVKF